jgi:hypothetical protein
MGDVVRSNAVSLKCTEANTESVVTDYTMEYAASNNILTGEATWDASTQGKADKTLCEVNSYDGEYDQGVNGYQGVSIYAIVKDTEGNLMGIDDSTAFSFGGGDPDIYAENNDLAVDDYSGALTAGGKVLIGCINPDMSAAAKYKLTVTTEDPDTSESDEDDLVESFYYVVSSIDSDYSLTRVRNAAKTSATWTADFGLECSNAIVYFDWENADGTKGTFSGSQLRRRANFDGVATLTLNKRSKSSSVISLIGAAENSAALLIRMSIRPRRNATSATAEVMLSLRVTSISTAMAASPSDSAARRARVILMSQMATLAPSAM